MLAIDNHLIVTLISSKTPSKTPLITKKSFFIEIFPIQDTNDKDSVAACVRPTYTSNASRNLESVRSKQSYYVAKKAHRKLITESTSMKKVSTFWCLLPCNFPSLNSENLEIIDKNERIPFLLYFNPMK